jgi:hypothetical protein
MAATDATAPRWPSVRAERGHYESYYLRAVAPTGSRGVWIRYTVNRPPSGGATGQLWCTFFDRAAPAPRAVRIDVGEPGTGSDAWIRFGDSSFGPDEVSGVASSAEHSAQWSLRHRSDQQPLRHLPRGWMYTGRLPRTKLVSPRPTAVFEGTLELDGETVDIAGWPGMVGHNWGEEHAEQWLWLSGLAFDGAGADTWLDVAVGRIRIGPWTTPWVANGAVSLDGHRLALGGLGRRVGVTTAEDGCVVRLPGSGATVTASFSAPRDAYVQWDYPSPDGSERRVRNCSVADLTMRVERPGVPPIELAAPGRGAHEWGRR